MGSPVDQMMQKFAKALAERTDNKIKLTYFAGGQLGGERDITEGVQLGTVGMSVTGVTSHPIWDTLWLPYVFRDKDHMWKTLRGPIGEGWGQQMLKERKMQVFGYAYRSPRNLTTTKVKVTKAADLKGLKLRTPEIEGELIGWRALGASPTPMPWPEVLTSLQSGIIDGQEPLRDHALQQDVGDPEVPLPHGAHPHGLDGSVGRPDLAEDHPREPEDHEGHLEGVRRLAGGEHPLPREDHARGLPEERHDHRGEA